MTLPDERLRALRNTRNFMRKLLDKEATPRVPMIIRQQARACLKHYPADYELDKLAAALPDLFEEERRTNGRRGAD